MTYEEVIKILVSQRNPKNVAGMARFGIHPKSEVLGISIPKLREIAKIIKKDHKLALKLWKSKIHEAKILAGFIADSEILTEKQMDGWIKDFDSWDIVDQVCSNLFDKTEFVYKKIFEIAERNKEFEKRTAFTLMATLSVQNKKMSNSKFLKFFPLIKKASLDERNFVKKAVNWALRQIGKRNSELNGKALRLAKQIQKIDSESARWIANDAIRELEHKKIKDIISNRNK